MVLGDVVVASRSISPLSARTETPRSLACSLVDEVGLSGQPLGTLLSLGCVP